MIHSLLRTLQIAILLLGSVIMLSHQVEAAETADRNSPASRIRLVWPSDPSPFQTHIRQIFAERLEQRCPAKLDDQAADALTLRFLIDRNIAREGFRIADGPDREIRISASDEHGWLFGLGKLMHGSRYDARGFSPGTWRGTSVPDCNFRCVYLATHFQNIYEQGPLDELEAYLDDLALWGFNKVMFHFPLNQYQSMDDPNALRARRQVGLLMKAAKRSGMEVGLGAASNAGFLSTPKELLNTPVPDGLGRRGHYGVNLCPSNPAGRALLLDDWKKMLDAFLADTDFIVFWPYDEGGCGCEQCWPWGSKGFVNISKTITEMARKAKPSVKTVLSTWCFDTPSGGEWYGLSKILDAKNDWVDAIMADAHEDYPRYPLEMKVPGGLPLLNFPEISMWGMIPWGGYGANPLPGRFQRLWDQVKGHVSGGAIYSEGIFEDLNKVIIGQFYWNRGQEALETVREYAAYYFSCKEAAAITSAVKELEATQTRGWDPTKVEAAYWDPSKVDKAGVEKACALLTEADSQLPDWARHSWRWRILYLRSLLDRERVGPGIKTEAARTALQELSRIYHVTDGTVDALKPPL